MSANKTLTKSLSLVALAVLSAGLDLVWPRRKPAAKTASAAGSVALIAVLCLLCVFAMSCGKEKDKDADSEPPASVEVDDVTRGPIDLIVEADAVLYPIDQASVTSKISAPVKRVLVNRGDHVKSGQLLAELESRDLAAAAEESRSLYDQAQASLQTLTAGTVVEDRAKAQADVQSAQQALEAAKKVYESRVELQRQGALAQKLVDDAKVAMVQAQSQYDTAASHLQALQQVSSAGQIRGAQAASAAAKAHLDSANVQVSYAEIRSPIDGIVSDRPVYPGEMAVSGTPIVSIVNISKVVARANIPLKEAGYIKPGKQATLTSPDGALTGAVTVVSPSVDPNTTTVQVWVQADNPEEKLKPGGTVHVAIRADLIQDTLLVPAAALLNSDEGGEMVLVVGKDSKAHERKVTVGIREGARVQILGGVNEGDKVITSGGLGLDDKAKVTIKEESDDDDDDDDDDAGPPAKDAPKPSPNAAPGAKK